MILKRDKQKRGKTTKQQNEQGITNDNNITILGKFACS
jgi:hypothetical protein